MEEKPTPKLIAYVGPPILRPPWSIVFDAPRDKVESAIEESIKMNSVYAAEKTIEGGVTHYRVFSVLFQQTDPPVCILLVNSEGDSTRVGIDPPTGRTYGSFFEVFATLMKLNGMSIPGTESEEEIARRKKQETNELEYQEKRKTTEESFERAKRALEKWQGGTAEELNPAALTKIRAKDVLEIYKKRKRQDKRITLKQVCDELGVNYGSIRVAKSRNRKRKTRTKKS